MFAVKIGIISIAPGSILMFAMFVSSAASSLVAFVTMVISISFVVLSMDILGWILDKDIGPRSM